MFAQDFPVFGDLLLYPINRFAMLALHSLRAVAGKDR